MSPLVALVISSSTVAITDAELDRRIAFLEEHLEAPQIHARAWWWGWLSFYCAAIAAQSIRLGLIEPDDEDRGAKRADFTISIIKSAGGIASLLLLPFDATSGASEMEEIAGDSREDRLRRLHAGELALERNAKQAERRGWWVRHAALVAVNLAHGLIVWLGWDDPERGMISAGVGMVVGEIIFWTQPWQPKESYQLYQQLAR